MAEETLPSWGLRWLFWAGVTVICMMAVAYGVTWMVGMTFFPYYQANPGALVVTGIVSSIVSAGFYVVTNYQRYLRGKAAFQERKVQEFMHRAQTRQVSPEENRRMAEHQTAMAQAGAGIHTFGWNDITRAIEASMAPPLGTGVSGGSGGIGMGALTGILATTQNPGRPHLVDITERNLANAPPTEDLVERIQADQKPGVPDATPPRKRDRYEVIKV